MDSTRRSAVVAGVFFIVAAVTAVIALALYGPVLNDANYVVAGAGNDSRIFGGAFLEVILAISVIGTAVTLFPIVKRQNESIALGYVAGRLIESMLILLGAICLVSVVTLRQDFAGGPTANTSALVAVAKTLVVIHNWTFLLGPSLAIGVNTSLLAYLMYRSALVPRIIPVLGLVGGPVIFAAGTAELFGLFQQVSAWGAIAAIPVTAWELSLAVWMVVKGFNPSAVTALSMNARPTLAGRSANA
jgi:Domain of unknown function (DUF4386)